MAALRDRSETGAIVVDHEGAHTRVHLVGAVDAMLRQQASDSMGLALMAGLPVVLDASQATFVDSSGVAFVLQLSRATREAGLELTLADPAGVLRGTLDLVGLVGLIPPATD